MNSIPKLLLTALLFSMVLSSASSQISPKLLWISPSFDNLLVTNNNRYFVFSNLYSIDVYNESDFTFKYSFKDHADVTCKISQSKSGNLLASFDEKGYYNIWDLASGVKLLSLNSKSEIKSIEFSPNERKIVVNHLGYAIVRDIYSADSTERLTNENLDVAKFISDSTILLPGMNSAKVYSLIEKKYIQNNPWQIEKGVLNRSGTQYAYITQDGFIKAKDVATGVELFSKFHFGSRFIHLVYDITGKYIFTAGDDYVVRIWNANTGEVLKTQTLHKKAVDVILFSNDSTMFVTHSTAENSTNVWSLSDFSLLSTLEKSSVVCFSQDSKVLMAWRNVRSGRNAIAYYNPRSGALIGDKMYREYFYSFDLDSSGSIVAGTSSGSCTVFEPTNYSQTFSTFGYSQPPRVTCSEDGKTALFAYLSRYHDIVKIDSTKRYISIDNKAPGVSHGRLSPNGKYCATFWGDNLQFWNAENGDNILNENALGTITDVKFSPSGLKCAVITDSISIVVYNTSTWEIEKKIMFNKTYSEVVWSTNEKHLLLGWGREQHSVVDIENASNLFVIDENGYPSHGYQPLTYNKQCTQYLCATKSGARVRNAATGEVAFSLVTDIFIYRPIYGEFNSDGSLILNQTSFNEFVLWNGKTGELLFNSKRISNFYFDKVRFSKDGRKLIILQEGRIGVWELYPKATQVQENNSSTPLFATVGLTSINPNPSQYSITCTLTSSQFEEANISVIDMLGNTVVEPIQKEVEPGNTSIQLNIASLNSGIYFVVVRAGSNTSTKSFVVVK